ncbi:hypothetical protein ACOME3_007567 [Neoechinorhynchus agilis]
MDDFESFVKGRHDENFFNIQSFRNKATFIAHNIGSLSSPDTIQDYEKQFHLKFKFFFKSRKTGKAIPVGIVKTDMDQMETLCFRKWIFQRMEITFTKDSNTDSNLIYPQCNICLQWGYWNQNCPNRTQKCSFCAEDHHMSSCTNKTSKCVNCGGSHRSYYKGCPCLKAYVDAWKKYSEMKRNPNILRTTPSAISHQTSPNPSVMKRSYAKRFSIKFYMMSLIVYLYFSIIYRINSLNKYKIY